MYIRDCRTGCTSTDFHTIMMKLYLNRTCSSVLINVQILTYMLRQINCVWEFSALFPWNVAYILISWLNSSISAIMCWVTRWRHVSKQDIHTLDFPCCIPTSKNHMTKQQCFRHTHCIDIDIYSSSVLEMLLQFFWI